TGRRQHPREIGYLAIAARRPFGRHDELDLDLGEFPAQALDKENRGITGVLHTENELILGITLTAERPEILVEFGFVAAQGLQNRDRRAVAIERLAPSDEVSDGDDSDKQIQGSRRCARKQPIGQQHDERACHTGARTASRYWPAAFLARATKPLFPNHEDCCCISAASLSTISW